MSTGEFQKYLLSFYRGHDSTFYTLQPHYPWLRPCAPRELPSIFVLTISTMLSLLLTGVCVLRVRTLPNTYVSGSLASTYTDGNGIALLKVVDGDTLRFHHVGFRDTSVAVSCSVGEMEVVLTPSAYMFPEVVVEKSIGENVSTRPVRAVRREEVLYPASPILRPDDVLESVPGVVFVGKDPTASVPAVRGLAFFRTLVVLDMMRLSTEREIGPSLFYAPVGVVRSVEVSEGGAVPFGSDAVGGAVMYFLKGVGDPNEVAVYLRSNPGSFALYGGYSPLDSAYVGVASSVSGDYTYPDTSVSNGLFGRGSLRAPSSNRKFASILEVRKWGMSVKGALFATRDFHRAYRGSTYYPEIDHAFLFLGTKYVSLGYHGYTTVSRKVKGDRATENVRTGRDVSVRFQADLRGMHVGASYFGRLGITSSVYSDGEWLYDELTNAGTHDLGLFLFGDVRLGRLMLSYGGRLGFYSASNTEGWRRAPAFHLGGRVSLGALTLTFNLETSYRFPTLTESSSRSPHPRGFLLGNPDLRPERGIGGDVAVSYEGMFGRVEVLGFHTLVRDYIDLSRANTLTPDGDTVFYYSNLPGTAAVSGLEASASGKVGRMELSLSYTYINGKAGAHVISGVPPSLLRAEVEYSGRLEPYTVLEYRPPVRDVALVEVPRPSSITVRAGFRLEILGWSIDCGAHNLNDAVAYRTLNPQSLPLPGRGVYISLRRTF